MKDSSTDDNKSDASRKEGLVGWRISPPLLPVQRPRATAI
jgi:hypothetical protein